MWHLGKLLVLPLIAMIAGLTSLYIDPKQPVAQVAGFPQG
jgi:hypothetical protein